MWLCRPPSYTLHSGYLCTLLYQSIVPAGSWKHLLLQGIFSQCQEPDCLQPVPLFRGCSRTATLLSVSTFAHRQLVLWLSSVACFESGTALLGYNDTLCDPSCNSTALVQHLHQQMGRLVQCIIEHSDLLDKSLRRGQDLLYMGSSCFYPPTHQGKELYSTKSLSWHEGSFRSQSLSLQLLENKPLSLN